MTRSDWNRCDGGIVGGFFPTDCGRESVHMPHQIGHAPAGDAEREAKFWGDVKAYHLRRMVRLSYWGIGLGAAGVLLALAAFLID